MSFTLGWPQMVYIALTIVGLILAATKHGKPETGTHNVWSSTAASAFVWWLLWCGGFFGGGQ